LNKLSLFSGIAGIDLAGKWAGMNTVAFCEREVFPQKVLRKHWPTVPIYDDVCTISKERLEADGIDTGTIRVISAGYPCQGESHAGKRKGKKDDRWLWPEVARLLEEITPDWFVGENVSGHITMGLDTVLADLGRLGYTAQSFHIPAIAVDGDHERYRIFVVAYADSKSGWETSQKVSAIRKEWGTREDVGGSSWRPIPRADWNISGPPISRIIDGISDRLDRSKALGNAVSPNQIYPILAAIKQIDDLIRS
jgi:DNA (cytosine-5)-methyltransferase 1